MAENQHETQGGAPAGDAPNGHDGREDNLVRSLGRTVRAMRRHLETTVGDVPGGMSAWWVLRHLHQAGPQAQADIADSVGVAGSTLTRRLEQMEADGLITRTPDETDKRRVIVALSERGEALRAGQRERADAEVARLTAGVAPADLEAFQRVMDRVRENLRDLGTDPDGGGRGPGGGRGFRSGFGPGGGHRGLGGGRGGMRGRGGPGGLGGPGGWGGRD